MDWKRLAIEQLEWYWQVSLRPRLEGLTDDEYFWEPVPGCWSIRPISREVMHHGAEVALLRDLYAHGFGARNGGAA